MALSLSRRRGITDRPSRPWVPPEEPRRAASVLLFCSLPLTDSPHTGVAALSTSALMSVAYSMPSALPPTLFTWYIPKGLSRELYASQS